MFSSAAGEERPVDRTTGRVVSVGAVRWSRSGWLGSVLVINDGDVPRELSGLVVPLRGSLEATGDLFEPYRLVDGDGVVVGPAAAFFAELAACGRPATTQRSYGMDLLRWFRFLWAVGVRLGSGDPGRGAGLLPLAAGRGQAGAAALAVSGRWRSRDRARQPAAARVNAVTGKPSRGRPVRGGDGGALRERAARLLRLPSGGRDRADGQPVPAGSAPRAGRGHAHHNPMEPFAGQRSGRYRPKVVTRAPRCIPDERFDELFAAAGLAPGPGAGRVLGLDRGAGLGAAGRHGRPTSTRASS